MLLITGPTTIQFPLYGISIPETRHNITRRIEVLEHIARISHELSLRKGRDAAETRRAAEAAAGVFEQYVEAADRAQPQYPRAYRPLQQTTHENAG